MEGRDVIKSDCTCACGDVSFIMREILDGQIGLT